MNPELTDTAHLATHDAFLSILLPFGAALNKNCDYPAYWNQQTFVGMLLKV